jgi:hypothetical protein
MPTYEYRCRECSHELEVVQSFSDDPLSPEPVESVLVDTVDGDVDDDPLLLSVL